MIYQLVTTDRFDKAFKKLDRQTKIIKAWIDKNLMHCQNLDPHSWQGLTSNEVEQWRYQ